MTYEQVKDLFAKYPVASTWNPANPRALYFDTGQKDNWKSRDLHAPNRGERYIRVPFAEVASHIEKTGIYNSENTFYRLRQTTTGDSASPPVTEFPNVTRTEIEEKLPGTDRQILKSRSKKYARFLLSASGALLVLGTFMVREALREHQKEIADGISSAEVLYTVQVLSVHLDHQFERVQDESNSLARYMITGGKRRPGIDFASSKRPRELVMFLERDIGRSTGYAERNLANSYVQLDTIRPLLDRLPDGHLEHARWKSLQEEIRTQLKEVGNFQGSIEDVGNIEDVAYFPKMTDEEASALAQKRQQQSKHALDLMNSTAKTGWASGQLIQDVVEAAKLQKDVAERKYISFTHLSLLFYPLGVLLALIGQFYGAEGPQLEIN